MTLEQFLLFDDDAQLNAVNESVCICSRTEGRFLIMLYQRDGFYIEVFYKKVNHQVVGLFAFNDITMLDPYLEKMPINLLPM